MGLPLYFGKKMDHMPLISCTPMPHQQFDNYMCQLLIKSKKDIMKDIQLKI